MVEDTKIPGGDPKMDENWWTSILQEKDQTAASETPEAIIPTGDVPDEAIDWERARQVHENDEIVEVQVNGFNQGGLLVRGEWLHGFIPTSHLSRNLSELSPEDHRKVAREYIGKKLNVKIIECNPDAERIVLSERAGTAGEGSRKRIISSLHPGDVVTGTVTNITDFGVFIDLGGIEGLAHVSELSWGKVSHPRELILVGQEIRALILNVNEANSRIGLSIKQLQPNPWEQIKEKYRPGDRLHATISSITRYGIFARLDEGVEGLIHNSVIKSGLSAREVAERYKVGQQILVCVIRIDAEHHRMGLSLVEDE